MDSVAKMSDVKKKLNEYNELFSLFEDPLDKFTQIIDFGKDAVGLPLKEKNDSSKIIGCVSQAWVVSRSNGDGTYKVYTDSDAFIVKGLLNILEKVLENRTAKEILSVNAEDILNNIGLNRSITSQRTNGFVSAIKKIHNDIGRLENGK